MIFKTCSTYGCGWGVSTDANVTCECVCLGISVHNDLSVKFNWQIVCKSGLKNGYGSLRKHSRQCSRYTSCTSLESAGIFFNNLTRIHNSEDVTKLQKSLNYGCS